jgi:hypothetical protein
LNTLIDAKAENDPAAAIRQLLRAGLKQREFFPLFQ